MIVINAPELRDHDHSSIMSSIIEIEGKKERLWYKFPKAFRSFLVTENLDAFLVGILFLGLKTGNDIKLKAPVSAKLFYTLNHYLIPALVFSNPELNKVRVIPEKLNYSDLNQKNVAGTGMSCGVDSFTTYYDHSEEEGPFQIKYFTFFNVGSHLDFGGENARKIFQKRLKSVTEFAEEEGVEIIPVDSNLSEILKMNFQKTHSLRSISCVLHLQKLFKNYYYSSAYRFDHFKLNSEDTSDSDIFNLQMLSTESTNFFASAAQFSRVERTLFIAEHPATFSKLDVCTNPSIDSPFINCSVCYKCLRTQLTLEAGNRLREFRGVFNIDAFEGVRNKYIGELFMKRNKSVLDIELIHFLKEKKYKFSIYSYYYFVTSGLNLQKKRFRKLLRNQLKRR